MYISFLGPFEGCYRLPTTKGPVLYIIKHLPRIEPCSKVFPYYSSIFYLFIYLLPYYLFSYFYSFTSVNLFLKIPNYEPVNFYSGFSQPFRYVDL